MNFDVRRFILNVSHHELILNLEFGIVQSLIYIYPLKIYFNLRLCFPKISCMLYRLCSVSVNSFFPVIYKTDKFYNKTFYNL